MDNGKEVLNKYSKKIKQLLTNRMTPEELAMIGKINRGEVKLEFGNVEQTKLIRKSELLCKLIDIGDVHGIIVLLESEGGLQGRILSDKIRDEYNP